MIHVDLNISEILSSFSLSRKDLDDIAEAVVRVSSFAVYNKIRILAGSGLGSTKKAYLQNLNTPEFGRLKGTIILTGVFPNMIEQGASPFDMKVGFLKSSKVKTGKNGNKYLTIPFRWATPGSGGGNAAFSNMIPTEIYDLISGRKGGRTSIGGKSTRSGRIGPSDISGTKYGMISTRPGRTTGSGTVYGSYTHKSPLLMGLAKQTKTYENATQSVFKTFRRVSLNSDKNSWIHKGLKARNFFEKGLEEADLDTVAGNTIDKELERRGI